MAAFVGTSVALYLSNGPFSQPIAGVRVGLIDDQFVINPTNPQQIQSKLELVVAGTESAIVMVECSAHEIPEERIIEAIEFAHEEIKKIIAGIRELFDQQPYSKLPVTPPELPADLLATAKQKHGAEILSALNMKGKLEFISSSTVNYLIRIIGEIPESKKNNVN